MTQALSLFQEDLARQARRLDQAAKARGVGLNSLGVREVSHRSVPLVSLAEAVLQIEVAAEGKTAEDITNRALIEYATNSAMLRAGHYTLLGDGTNNQVIEVHRSKVPRPHATPEDK